MKSLQTLLMLVLFIGFMSSCGNESANDEETNATNHLIQISKEQFNAESMSLGNTQMHTFKKVFKTNGIVTAAPQSKADVYSYLSGIVKKISVTPGNFVKRGQLLFSLESKEFINLQKQYLMTTAQLKSVKAEYERVKELHKENIASQKEYFAAESKYKTLEAQIEALKAELNIAHINIEKLENGKIASYLSIVSPISGYVSEIKCNTGEYIDTQTLLARVVDSRDLQLHFFVYQETVGNLHEGQPISIYSPNRPEKSYKATISSIGKYIDPETKSIRCIAEPENNLKKIFVDGMYFQVEVVTDTLVANALPSEAVIKSGDGHYVLVKEKEDTENYYFKKVYLKTGISDDQFTQVLEDKKLENVLVKGTYYYQ